MSKFQPRSDTSKRSARTISVSKPGVIDFLNEASNPKDLKHFLKYFFIFFITFLLDKGTEKMEYRDIYVDFHIPLLTVVFCLPTLHRGGRSLVIICANTSWLYFLGE